MNDGARPASRRLLDPVAAWYVGNVLLGAPPPENAAGGRIAFKTGTSYGYRDAWAVGFDGRRTIGVWVGRPDGSPVPGLVGRTAAAPILFDAFARARPAARAAGACAEGGTVRVHGEAAAAACSASGRAAALPATAPSPALRIMFPPNGVAHRACGDRRQARSAGIEDRGRRRTADRAGQRPAALQAGQPAHAVFRARRSGLRAADRDRRPRRVRQRHGPGAVDVHQAAQARTSLR